MDPNDFNDGQARRGWRRSRILRLLPVLAVVAAAAWLLSDAPREVELAYRLDGRRPGLTGLEVELFALPERAPVRRAEFRYRPGQAPAEQVHPVRLLKGSYEVRATFRLGDSAERAERAFRFDGEARLTLTF